MKIADIIEIIEKFAPLEISYAAMKDGHHDNSGFLLGDVNAEFSGAVVCIDVTNEAVDYAIEKGASLMISHHPFIYYPISSLDTKTVKGEIVGKLFKNGISVYSAHLNMDLCAGGIDDTVAEALGIKADSILERVEKGSYGKAGNVGEQKFSVYLEKVRAKFGFAAASMPPRDKKISRVASFCGSGLDFPAIDFCKKSNVDIVISCDIPHHHLLEIYEQGMETIMLAHGESELFAFAKIMKNLFPNEEKMFYFMNDYRLN